MIDSSDVALGLGRSPVLCVTYGPGVNRLLPSEGADKP